MEIVGYLLVLFDAANEPCSVGIFSHRESAQETADKNGGLVLPLTMGDWDALHAIDTEADEGKARVMWTELYARLSAREE